MSPKEQTTTSVDPYNILCGRGKDTFHSGGNRRYRKHVLEWVPLYVAAPRRLEKSLTVQALVEKIKADGGRFLKRQITPSGPVLVELGMKQTRQKVGHSLRDMAATIAKSKDKKAGGRTKACQSKSVETKKARLSEHADHKTVNYDIGTNSLALQEQEHLEPPKSERPKPHPTTVLSGTQYKDQECSSPGIVIPQHIAFPHIHSTTQLHRRSESSTSEREHAETDLRSTSSWGPLAQTFFNKIE